MSHLSPNLVSKSQICVLFWVADPMNLILFSIKSFLPHLLVKFMGKQVAPGVWRWLSGRQWLFWHLGGMWAMLRMFLCWPSKLKPAVFYIVFYSVLSLGCFNTSIHTQVLLLHS